MYPAYFIDSRVMAFMGNTLHLLATLADRLAIAILAHWL
jgi:hypothetical protein